MLSRTEEENGILREKGGKFSQPFQRSIIYAREINPGKILRIGLGARLPIRKKECLRTDSLAEKNFAKRQKQRLEKRVSRGRLWKSRRYFARGGCSGGEGVTYFGEKKTGKTEGGGTRPWREKREKRTEILCC